MAQIYVNIQAVKNDNNRLYSLIWQVEQCEDAMAALMKKIDEEDLMMADMREELLVITAEIRRIQEKIRGLYHITNRCMDEYIILENELEQRVGEFL